MTKIISLRYGTDGGSVCCGPIEGEYVAEGMFKKDEKFYFVSISRWVEGINYFISKTSYYDLLLHITEVEDPCAIDNYLREQCEEYRNTDIDSLDKMIKKSNYSKEIKFIDEALQYFIDNEEEAMLPEDYIADYKDKDIETL